MRMPFGKHKGSLIEKIPTSYLAWLLQTCDLERWLSAAVKEELAYRRREREARSEDCDHTYPAPGNFPEVLRRCHREMVLRFHSDRGGSHEAMVAVNACFERLQGLLEQAVA